MRNPMRNEERSHPAYTWYVVGLLAVVNLFNYMDRMLLSVLLPDIKHELSLSDSQLGLLTGLAFALFYATAGLPIARLADLWIRKRIIALSLVAWSLMTAVSGAAQTFWHLAAARVGVGVGEAGCVPASQSLISDTVPFRRRPVAFSVHLAGSMVGIMLGLALGGWIAQHFGWRNAFLILGLAGIPLAVIVSFTLREPVRGQADGPRAAATLPLSGREALAALWKQRTFRQLVLVYGIANFSTFGINQWLPMFYSRSHGMTTADIGLFLGLVLGLGMTAGAVVGGMTASRLMRRDSRWAAWFCMIVAVLAVPFTATIFLADNAAVALAANFASAALSGSTAGPITTLVQSVVLPAVRSLAAAFVGFAASLIGMGLGPLFVGVLSDALLGLYGQESLRYSMLVAAFIPIWAVAHLGIAQRTMNQDIAAVTGAAR